ncbi:TerD family protein, partial [Clostridioides difficile]|uniref:TerD family protein n=1 Tax=Clostridioides difficile TaxID=1496 RepID=UPI0018DC9BEB
YIRVEDQGNKKEISKYNLYHNYSDKTTLIVGAIDRKDGSWQFKAIGDGRKDAGLKEVMQNLDRIACAYGI